MFCGQLRKKSTAHQQQNLIPNEARWKKRHGLTLLCCFRIWTLLYQSIKRFYRRQQFNRFVRVMEQKWSKMLSGNVCWRFCCERKISKLLNLRVYLLCPAYLVSDHSMLLIHFEKYNCLCDLLTLCSNQSLKPFKIVLNHLQK